MTNDYCRDNKMRNNKTAKYRSTYSVTRPAFEVKKLIGGLAIGIVSVLALSSAGVLAFASETVPEAPETRVETACDAFEMDCEIVDETSESVARGGLIGQSVKAGWSVIPAKSIKLTYSLGPASAIVPDVSGMSLEEARTLLYSLGLDVDKVEFKKSEDYSPGQVIATSIEKGEKLDNGSTIDLEVAGSIVDLPDWVGETQKHAEAEARDLGLKIIIEHEESKETPGTILSQYPKPGEVETGSEVRITIAKEIESVDIEVPDVIGEDQITAQSILAEAGFRFISTVEVENSEVSKTQVTQVVPGVGQTAPSDSQIVIIVSRPSTD